jgi:hypothetical protein
MDWVTGEEMIVELDVALRRLARQFPWRLGAMFGLSERWGDDRHNDYRDWDDNG